MLVEEHRLDQLGNAGSQSLGTGADAAVMHQGGTKRRQALQGDEWEMPNAGRQTCGQLIAIGGQKDGPQLKTLTDRQRLLEKTFGLAHEATGRENNGAGPIV